MKDGEFIDCDVRIMRSGRLINYLIRYDPENFTIYISEWSGKGITSGWDFYKYDIREYCISISDYNGQNVIRLEDYILPVTSDCKEMIDHILANCKKD